MITTVKNYIKKDKQVIHSNIEVSKGMQIISEPINVTKYSFVDVTLRANVADDALADPNAQVDIVTSPDGVNFDYTSGNFVYTTALTFPLDAGTERQIGSNPIDVRTKPWIKTVVTCLDASRSLSAASLIMTKTMY